MTNTRSNAKQAPRDQRYGNGFALPDMSAFQTPPGLELGKRLGGEVARFWAKRLHAYAEHLETLAGCSDPPALIEAQMAFLKKAQGDYAAEGEVIKRLVQTRVASTSEDNAQDIP